MDSLGGEVQDLGSPLVSGYAGIEIDIYSFVLKLFGVDSGKMSLRIFICRDKTEIKANLMDAKNSPTCSSIWSVDLANDS